MVVKGGYNRYIETLEMKSRLPKHQDLCFFFFHSLDMKVGGWVVFQIVIHFGTGD